MFGSNTIRPPKHNAAKPITLKAAKERLEEVNMNIKNTGWNDYRVSFPGGSEASAYYTTDLTDAVLTGIDMRERQDAAKG